MNKLKKLVEKVKKATTLPEGYIVAHDGPNRAIRRRVLKQVRREQRRMARKALRMKKLGMRWMLEVA